MQTIPFFFFFLTQRLHQLGVTPVVTADPPPPAREQQPNSNPFPPRPDSLILGAPIGRKDAQRRDDEDDGDGAQDEVGEEATECCDTERTVEGSSATESRKQSYAELEGTFNGNGGGSNEQLAKEEPAVVSLEFGVARMTC